MCAKRTARGNIPLEWKTDVVNITDTTSATPVTGEFDLDLLPDEIAEILSIDSTIDPGSLGIIDNPVSLGMYLSMDPDADDDPLVLGNIEDLEVFFSHYLRQEISAVTAASVFFQNKVSKKQQDLPEKYPILIGTNFSQVVNGVSTVDVSVSFITTVYFKRKKASGLDLANILLKRR
ncbi:MAG: hypothetical protein V3T88_08730 [Nitrosomonadaceae bacterium]